MAKPESTLWTPSKKLPERVKGLALQLFIEMWKASFQEGSKRSFEGWDDDKIYKRCVATAQTIAKLEAEDQK